MLTVVKGTYDHGQIIFHETPPVQERTEVIVMFLEKETLINKGGNRKREGGSMKGEVWMADNFNDPLDDLKEYM